MKNLNYNIKITMKKVLMNLAFVAATVLTFTACSEKKTDEVNNFRIQRGTTDAVLELSAELVDDLDVLLRD